jgi:hypothetical protein
MPFPTTTTFEYIRLRSDTNYGLEDEKARRRIAELIENLIAFTKRMKKQ